MKRSSSIRATLFNRDPNESKYPGRKGMTVSVVRGDIGDSHDEVWEWRMRYFSPQDKVNGAFEAMKMNYLLEQGWQKVTDSTVACWECIEKDGVKFGTEEGFVKLF